MDGKKRIEHKRGSIVRSYSHIIVPVPVKRDTEESKNEGRKMVIRKHLIHAFILGLLSTGATTGEGKDIFLLIGQSNMLGRSPIQAQDKGPIPGAYVFHRNNTWVTAENPLGIYSNIAQDQQKELGPGYTFAKTLTERFHEKDFGLIVNARGSSSLIRNWIHRNAGIYWKHLYDSSLVRTRRALAENPQNRLRGILWHQGESDRDNSRLYLDTLVKFVQNWREDLGMPDLPFIAGEIGPWTQKAEALNAQIRQLPVRLPHTAVVSSEGLRNQGGGGANLLHYDSPSMRTLGNRFAIAAINLIYSSTRTDTNRLTLMHTRSRSSDPSAFVQHLSPRGATDGYLPSGRRIKDISIPLNQAVIFIDQNQEVKQPIYEDTRHDSR